MLSLVITGAIIIFSGCTETPTPSPTTPSIPISSPTPTLTAIISTPTVISTPTLTSTSIPSTFSITITSPREEDIVPWRYIVKGTSNGVDDPKLSIYVLIYPVEAGGPWWVQSPVDIPANGNWKTTVYFGRYSANYPEDDEAHFRVSAIITSERLTEGQQFEKIPTYINRSEIDVIRE
jgi:hypothetical protein